MRFLDFFVNNFVMVYELVGLLIMLGISVHVSKQMKIINIAVVILMIVETLVFQLERWTQTFETLSVARPLLTASVYTLYPIILLLMMQVTSSKRLTFKRFMLLLIPEIVSVPLYYSSQWTRLIFYFEPDNIYTGGDFGLSIWPYVVFAFYFGVFAVYNFIYLRKQSNKTLLVAAYVLLVPVMGVIVYKLFEIDNDYSPIFTSAILLYYLFIYIYNSKIDPLTSLLNRQSYIKAIENEAKDITVVVSVDMNDLKYFNDNFGHLAGDEAIKSISKILLDYRGPKGDAYRVGGDEFMLLYRNATEEEVKNAIATMQSELSKTKYMCAFGYAMRYQMDPLNDAIVLSDQRMYENKAKIKAERIARGEEDHSRS